MFVTMYVLMEDIPVNRNLKITLIFFDMVGVCYVSMPSRVVTIMLSFVLCCVCILDPFFFHRFRVA